MADAETTGTEGDPKAGSTTTNPDPEPDTEGLNENGKAALKRLGEQRDAARTEAQKVKEERDALLKEKTAADAAKAKEQEEAAAKRGEFEQLALKREGERDKAREEAASLTAQLDQYRAAVAAALESEWKALGPDVTEYYEGAADDPLAQLSWLPKGKKLADKFNGGANPRGNGPDPKPKGAANGRNEEAAKLAFARAKSNF